MSHLLEDRVISLAGVFQAASLVDRIANEGTANNVFIENSLETLFRFDADTVTAVYGGIMGVQHGLRTLQEEFAAGHHGRNALVTRYVVSLLALEKKLSAQPDMLDTIAEGLQDIEEQMDYFSLENEHSYTRIADVYRSTISELGPKIIIEGEQHHLNNQRNASKIRSLLLAGIRSAVLWRQCGGSRWQVLFSRQKYIDTASALLA